MIAISPGPWYKGDNDEATEDHVPVHSQEHMAIAELLYKMSEENTEKKTLELASNVAVMSRADRLLALVIRMSQFIRDEGIHLRDLTKISRDSVQIINEIEEEIAKRETY